ncbi:murein DD-endopeptidase MepM/ murein hydrolase activator NlpD [Deinococcus sp. HSC-46F16]|uniref:M23 family metallopeptidase n=1 Tax=Deinococcus sp. HSC-46F16 TaxID=2910968 RepID=UPI0020A1C8A1|nr:murein DD-endopeptidase MepM/ murein hydrolase activator NlpD [Deinococcus sp. HSC-46F16]
MNPTLIRRSRRPVVRGLLAAAALLLPGLLPGGTAEAAGSYRVKPGDNLTVIAGRAGVSIAALKSANPALRNANYVRAGQVLRIPDRVLAGRTHRVRGGENLTVIARRYGVSLAQLLGANPAYRGGKVLRAGATVRIPPRTVASGLRATPARTGGAVVRAASVRVSAAPASSRGWLWPVAGYAGISSDFGQRIMDGEREMHYGVDILAPHGSPVRAARSGRVIESRADFKRGWGWTVVLEHPDGWITRYAHLSANLVRAGETVAQGQVIGRVGNTGRSTGTHLHFGTYLRWNPKDPLSLYE